MNYVRQCRFLKASNPSVAVIDLDEVPRDIVENEYSTQIDLYGLTCLVMLFEIIITVTLHASYLFDWIWVTCDLLLCLYVVFTGDGTLTLARRSDTPTPGCAVLLDQDFTVVLNGSQSVVEAIAESSFNLSHPNSVWRFRRGVEDHDQDFLYDLLEASCEAAYLIASCWFIFRPSNTLAAMAPMAAVPIIGYFFQRLPPDRFVLLQEPCFITKGIFSRGLPLLLFVMMHAHTTIGNSFFSLDWQRDLHFLTFVLIVLVFAGYRTRNYPIRSGKFLDALGHPRVRKWQFNTVAAAATFKCLVLCHGIARPIRSIDVFAFLDMLVPDQRDVQKAWKERVAGHQQLDHGLIRT